MLSLLLLRLLGGLGCCLECTSTRSAGFAFARHALITARFNALALGGDVGV